MYIFLLPFIWFFLFFLNFASNTTCRFIVKASKASYCRASVVKQKSRETLRQRNENIKTGRLSLCTVFMLMSFCYISLQKTQS